MHTPPSTALLPAHPTPGQIQLCDASCSCRHWAPQPQLPPDNLLQAFAPLISSVPHTEAKLLDKGLFSATTAAPRPFVPTVCRQGRAGRAVRYGKAGIVRETLSIYLKVL